MLNIKAEYENNMKLKEDIEKNGFAFIDKSKYRVFVTTNTANNKIITQNKGLPRALRSVAWGEWFCGDYKDFPVDEKVKKIEQIMKEWKKKVYDNNKKNVKEENSDGQKNRLDIFLEENSCYQLICEAVALGKDGLGIGKTELPCIKIPMKVVNNCVEKGYSKEELLTAAYYHYVPKDEDGFILIEKLDFGKWISETTEYDKIVNTLITEKDIIKANEQGKITKIKITADELKWDDDCDENIIEFTDNGERGMARQAESAFEILKKIDPKMKSRFWKEVSKETKEKIRQFFIEVALNECNWNYKVEKERWKMTQEQSKKKKELFKEATAEGLTNDHISDILVMDE